MLSPNNVRPNLPDLRIAAKDGPARMRDKSVEITNHIVAFGQTLGCFF